VTGVSLSGNKMLPDMDNYDHLFVLKWAEQVVSLGLSDNVVFHCDIIRNYWFAQLTALDLSKNNIDIIRGIGRIPTQKYLSLYGNKLTHTSGISFLHSFPKLTYLNLDAQVSSFEVDAGILEHPSLMELHLNTKMDRQVSYSNYLKIKKSHSMHNNSLSSELQQLYAEGSNLNIVDEKTFLAIFGHLTKLRMLSLIHSQLDFISSPIVSPFTHLTTLVLKDNAITMLPEGVFDSLLHLTHLDLSGNKITLISPHTFSTELRQQFTVLDLGQNPFVCSCDLMWFRQWYIGDRSLFNQTESLYVCRDKQLKLTFEQFNLHPQACLLSQEVSSIVIFFSTVVVTSMTAFLVLFRFRWHLRLVLYEAFRGRDVVRRRYLQQGHFDFDVFVTYAKENLPWVRQNLIAELEGRLGLRLCIHERDFITHYIICKISSIPTGTFSPLLLC
jgi:hypothetical protein